MQPLTGQDYYNAVSTMISGFNMDQTMFLQLLNTARIQIELMRPWMKLRKYQYSQIATPAQPVLTPFTSQQFTIPSDFLYLNKDGVITLYDNNNNWSTYTEVALDLIIPYLQVNNTFVMDHANGYFYLNGVVDRQYTIFIPYQANLGDITLTSQWQNIPSAFHMLLVYYVLVNYRLGVDYDDIQARNAENNAEQAKILLSAMTAWDDNLQRSATTRMDIPTITESVGNFNHKINTQG